MITTILLDNTYHEESQLSEPYGTARRWRKDPSQLSMKLEADM